VVDPAGGFPLRLRFLHSQSRFLFMGSFVLILHTHLPYVLHHGKWPHGSDWLSEAAAECYIPILNECHALMADGIVPNITLSFSPVVVEQLADPEFASIFNAYLDEKIEAAEKDIVYFTGHPDDAGLIPLARFWRDWYAARRDDFNERYGADLVGAFRRLMEEGGVALQTCGATHGYFPLLGRDESIHGQLGVAVSSHRRHFGVSPRGVWMPECAYRPSYRWQAPVPNPFTPSAVRAGVEQLLALHGLEYTIVDSHLTRGGRPLGIFSHGVHGLRPALGSDRIFPPLNDSRSIHELYQICSTGDPEAGMAAIFTRDTETTLKVWSAGMGYPGDPSYLEFHKKHHNSGHRYWRITDAAIDIGLKEPYRPDVAALRIRAHAEHFVSLIERELAVHDVTLGHEGTLAAPFDTELFGHWWFEGPAFLGEVLRCLSRSPIATARTAPDELDLRDPQTVIQIPEGSWGEGGGHDVWLNGQTAWTWPLIYEIEARFLALIRERRSGEAERRVLRQLARENLLLQASDWQFLITTGSAAEYATERFAGHYDNARLLIDLLDHLGGGGTLSDGQLAELERLERVNRLFPELDLDAWSLDLDPPG
jgi:1,4-alpha-glucan branching enzyme